MGVGPTRHVVPTALWAFFRAGSAREAQRKQQAMPTYGPLHGRSEGEAARSRAEKEGESRVRRSLPLNQQAEVRSPEPTVAHLTGGLE
jgi:hypothetical protein